MGNLMLYGYVAALFVLPLLALGISIWLIAKNRGWLRGCGVAILGLLILGPVAVVLQS